MKNITKPQSFLSAAVSCFIGGPLSHSGLCENSTKSANRSGLEHIAEVVSDSFEDVAAAPC